MKLKNLKASLYNPRSVVNLCFIVVLLFVGLLLNSRIKTLLYGFVEGQVARQAATVAEKVSTELESEMGSIQYRSAIFQQTPEKIDRAYNAMQNANPDMKIGILKTDGEALFGEAISAADFPGIQSSFRGKSIISYNASKGLLFTCPIYNGENIKYVFYELCPKANVTKRFSVSCYDGMGKVLVLSRNDELIVPFENAATDDINFFFGDEISSVFPNLTKALDLSVSASKRALTSEGEYYVFAAEVPNTSFYIAGYVSSSVAAEGAYNIVLLVGRVFELIVVLFVVGSVYLIITSGRLRENEELVRAKQVAEEASRAKSEFLANMSHEIRTPINAILGMDEMILREYDEPGIRQYALNIRNAGNTLLSIINDILDFSKIESGKMVLVPVVYDISLVMYDLVSMTKPRAEDKGLTFAANVNPNLPRGLFGDNIRIKQCVLNILTNAVKYTPKGSVILTADYENTLDGYIDLKISVKDTGIGIKPEDMQKLFSPFERVDEERNRAIEGTGLGISIVRRLLDMMGSELKVESEYGKGSEFSFTVRQEVRDETPIGDYEKNYINTVELADKYRGRFTAPEARILFVDDIEMNLTVAAGLLKNTEIRIDTALSAKNALLHTEKKEYDILFIDDRMPGMGGIEMLKELRSRQSNPNCEKTCIVLTANAIAGARENYIKEGFEDYLPKPIDAAELEMMLLKYLPSSKIIMKEEPEGEAPEADEGASTIIREKQLDELRKYIGEEGELYDAVQLLMKRVHK